MDELPNFSNHPYPPYKVTDLIGFNKFLEQWFWVYQYNHLNLVTDRQGNYAVVDDNNQRVIWTTDGWPTHLIIQLIQNPNLQLTGA